MRSVRWKAAPTQAIAMLGVATALACWSVPAAADWQYTQWGMTPAEVKAASADVARDNHDRKLDAAGVKAELIAPFQGVSLPFTAVFLFDAEDKLTYVTLNPVGQIACPVIIDALSANYGKPQGKADMVLATTIRWNDLGNDNLVVYFDLGGGNCTIQYSKLPLTSPDGKGL